MSDVINVIKLSKALYAIAIATPTDIICALIGAEVSFSGLGAPENLVGYLLRSIS